jgi:hypothetical protein
MPVRMANDYHAIEVLANRAGFVLLLGLSAYAGGLLTTCSGPETQAFTLVCLLLAALPVEAAVRRAIGDTWAGRSARQGAPVPNWLGSAIGDQEDHRRGRYRCWLSQPIG